MEQMRAGVLRGLAVFRWLAWIWMATVLALARGNLVAPLTAVALVVVALGVTVWLTVLLRSAPGRLVTAPVVGVEVGVAMALQLVDGFVYRAPHVFTSEQPLGVAWPIAAVLSAGVALGPAAGALTGGALGIARAISSTLNVQPVSDPWLGVLTPEQTLSLVTTTVMFALAGGIAGYAMGLLRAAERRVVEAERSVAALRTREEVARQLHDGVLQTLAVVERRADDPQLARLARDQERQLRTFLQAEPGTSEEGEHLATAVRAAAHRVENAYGNRIEVLVPDDLPELDAHVVAALTGAVGEALTNAGKHSGAGRVVVYAEPDELGGVFVSVRDDGRGFDPTAATAGLGLRRSVCDRVRDVGGEVEIASSPGRGTEVRLTVPDEAAGDATSTPP